METINKLKNPVFKSLETLKYTFKGVNTPQQTHPFWVMVQKDISDHVRSLRFIILIVLIILTCFGTLYNAMSHLNEALHNTKDPNNMFAFLKLLTATDGSLPSFLLFMSFMSPLLGISLGFDAVNSEHNSGSLVRVISQPIHRDYVINAKFVSALTIISILFFSLSFIFIGFGILFSGLTPTFNEFIRIMAFTTLTILYVSFWLNLSILFSIKFKQASTSALTCIGIWLFFSVFYQIIINIAAKTFIPVRASQLDKVINIKKFFSGLLNIAPNQLFTDASTTLLMPSVRSLGPLSFTETLGAIPSALTLTDSLIIVWPQLTGLIAATIFCFALSYYIFMRKEIRP